MMMMGRTAVGITGLLPLLLPWTGYGLSPVVLSRRDAVFLLSFTPLIATTATTPVVDAAARTPGAQSSSSSSAIIEPEGPIEAAGRPATALRRPYAPIEALVPAIRVALQIEQSLAIVASQKTRRPAGAAFDDNDDSSIIAQLRTLWIVDDHPIDDYFGGQQQSTMMTKNASTLSSNNNINNAAAVPGKTFLDRYERNRQELSLLQQPGALLVERGEIAAWQNLRRRERRQSLSQPVRAAFNYYTDALQFDSTSYRLTAPPAERSRMIRNDQLPDINQVVTSDLDLRYLYRNQVLTNMDDVVAELQRDEECDLPEVIQLLETATASMRQWLDLIDPNDVKAARTLALQ
jgi:hypothetical protein